MLSNLALRCTVAVAASGALSSFAPLPVQSALAIPFFAVPTAAWAMSLACAGLPSNFSLTAPMETAFRSSISFKVNAIKLSNTTLFAIAAVIFAGRCAFPEAVFELKPASLSLESLAVCTPAVAAFSVFKSFHTLFSIKMEASDRVVAEENARRSREYLDRIEPR